MRILSIKKPLLILTVFHLLSPMVAIAGDNTWTGNGPFATQKAWEDASIDGLCDCLASPNKAGYDKSLSTTPKLLYFWDMGTGAPL